MTDRFDIAEAYWVLACDYGIYPLVTRLERMGFRPSPMLRHDTLSEVGLMVYEQNEDRAARTDPYARRLVARS